MGVVGRAFEETAHTHTSPHCLQKFTGSMPFCTELDPAAIDAPGFWHKATSAAFVGPVRVSLRISRGLRVFEHGVHVHMRAHDLAQTNQVIQDGFATRLRRCRSGHSRLDGHAFALPDSTHSRALPAQKPPLIPSLILRRRTSGRLKFGGLGHAPWRQVSWQG